MTMPVPPTGTAAPAAPTAPVAPEAPAAPVAPATPAAPAPGTPATPEWDGPFDPERAARLVANLRDEGKGYKDQLAAVQAKLTEFETAQMSDAEKLTQRAALAESELTKARRELAVRDALTTHGLSKDAARFLTGDTAEEIGEAAKAFAALAGGQPATADPLPPTLPIPGNGSDPAAVAQLSREDAEKLSHSDLMAAYRAGRLRNIGGK